MILVDTHVVLWLAFDPRRISRRARSAIAEARKSADALAISDISLLELSTLARKGRIRIGIGMESFLQEVESRFVVLPISGRACIELWDFQRRIPEIRQIVLSAPPLWSRD